MNTYEDFDVELTIKLATRVAFDTTGREGTITPDDAIANAIGSLNTNFIADLFDDGFNLQELITGRILKHEIGHE